jgi:uncharacterized repeat protein (TIGR04076 family)
MSKKIKVMSILSKKIKNLKEGDKFIFTYGDKDYEFYCHSYSENFGPSFSIHESGSFLGLSMNVDKVTKKYITLYDYNLFKVRSTFKIPVNKIKIF